MVLQEISHCLYDVACALASAIPGEHERLFPNFKYLSCGAIVQKSGGMMIQMQTKCFIQIVKERIGFDSQNISEFLFVVLPSSLCFVTLEMSSKLGSCDNT